MSARALLLSAMILALVCITIGTIGACSVTAYEWSNTVATNLPVSTDSVRIPPSR